MSNLTFDEGLLKEHDAAPLEGHTVVVLEQVGTSGGEKFHSLLPPGTPLKSGLIGIFRPHVHRFGIAVDAAPDLHLEFSEHVVLADDAGHRCDLLFDLYYSVADPRLLVSHRKRDPLRLLRDRAAQVIRRDVMQLKWSEIVHAFTTYAEEVVQNRLGSLAAVAAQYGIVLLGVELARLLPVDATDPVLHEERKLGDISSGERITTAQLEADGRVKDSERLQVLGSAELAAAAREVAFQEQLREAEVGARTQALRQIADGISKPEEFRATFGIGIRPTPGYLDVGAAPSRLETGPRAGGTGALPAAIGGLGGVLHQVLACTQSVSGSGTRLELRSALLHLVAEVLREDQGDPAVVQRHADRVRGLIGTLGSLPQQERDVLYALTDPLGLGASLRS